MKINNNLWKSCLPYCKLALSLALVLVILNLFRIPCPIKYLTGISCPGCGMSRACISALRLDFAAAFAYHPLWIALPFALGSLLYCKIGRHRRAFSVLLTLSVLLLTAVYLWRMLTGAGGDVVVFTPQNGIAVRVFRAFFRI